VARVRPAGPKKFGGKAPLRYNTGSSSARAMMRLWGDSLPDSVRSKLFLSFLGIALLACGFLAGARLDAKYVVAAAGLALAAGFGYIHANRVGRPAQPRGFPGVPPALSGEAGVPRNTAGKSPDSGRLLQFEKQASIGKLAGGVAHEINNPLTGIVTLTDLLLRRKNLPDDMRADLETIAEATDRVRKIVKGLLDFSSQTELYRECADVNVLCRSAVALVGNRALIRNVTLSLEPGDGLPMVRLDRNQMQGVLLHVIMNALDATGPGGRVTVSTRNGVSAGHPDGEGIEIICSDTGCGIAAENLGRIFDPFFTTKDFGQGTGLGLSVSHGIVERHGGTITVESRVGQGSTFTIRLPIQEQGVPDEKMGG